MDRRTFLVASGSALAASALPRTPAVADPALGPFAWGVASGDPLPDRVILWTRVDPAAAPKGAEVAWVVATDPALRKVVARGLARAEPERDHTVKVDAAGLRPGTTYFYGFTALGRASLTGRTRTAPTGAVDKLRLGLVTCSKYQEGFFNAFRTLAERDDLHAVLHVGDYIYESGGAGEVGRPPSRGAVTVTLQDYRARYAQHHLDPDLRLLHQRFAFITVWDDHESCNDSYRDGALDHDPRTQGPWSVRKAAAQRAYEEWLPIRLPVAGDRNRIFRELAYGDLADLIMLDTRLYGRDLQVSKTNAVGTPGTLDGTVDDPARTLLGRDQEAWLADRLSTSQRSGRRWRVIVQQVMFSQLNLAGFPETEQLSLLPTPDGGVSLNPDQWDGYTATRQRLFDVLDARRIDNVVVLPGDFHASFASDCAPDPNTPYSPLTTQGYDPLTGDGARAVEFVTPSVTSSNFDEEYGDEVAAGVGAGIPVLNRHIKFADVAENGYVVLTLTPDRVQGDYWFVDTVAKPSPVETPAASWLANAQTEGSFLHLVKANAPAQPGAAQARPPASPPAVRQVSSPPPARPSSSLPATGGLPGAGLAASVVAAALALRRRGRQDEKS